MPSGPSGIGRGITLPITTSGGPTRTFIVSVFPFLNFYDCPANAPEGRLGKPASHDATPAAIRSSRERRQFEEFADALVSDVFSGHGLHDAFIVQHWYRFGTFIDRFLRPG